MFKRYMIENFSLEVLKIAVLIYGFLLYISFSSILKALSYEINFFSCCSSSLKSLRISLEIEMPLSIYVVNVRNIWTRTG